MANQRKGNTVEAVRRLAEPIAEGLGLQVWDVRFVKEGADWILRIIIDRPEGVGISDCEAMSRAMDAPLDEADLIDQSYCLEVSSPGIERELFRPEHFEKMAGRAVLLHRIRPDTQGLRELQGKLIGLTDDGVQITCTDGTVCTVPRKELSSVTLIDTFDDKTLEGE